MTPITIEPTEAAKLWALVEYLYEERNNDDGSDDHIQRSIEALKQLLIKAGH